jgi:hypothetical protein
MGSLARKTGSANRARTLAGGCGVTGDPALITFAVLWNRDRHAKLAGLAWLAICALHFVALRWMGRPTAAAEI